MQSHPHPGPTPAHRLRQLQLAQRASAMGCQGHGAESVAARTPPVPCWPKMGKGGSQL